MDKSLPQKVKNNIFHRFFSKIKSLFVKNAQKKSKVDNSIDDSTQKVNTLNDLKVDLPIDTKKYKKNDLMKNLEEHPDLLDSFPNDKLEKILQYYLDENEKKRKLLKKLSA